MLNPITGPFIERNKTSIVNISLLSFRGKRKKQRKAEFESAKGLAARSGNNVGNLECLPNGFLFLSRAL
jgi:hypothetical protein